MLPNLQFHVDLVKFTEEIINEKLHLLFSGSSQTLHIFQHISI